MRLSKRAETKDTRVSTLRRWVVLPARQWAIVESTSHCEVSKWRWTQEEYLDEWGDVKTRPAKIPGTEYVAPAWRHFLIVQKVGEVGERIVARAATRASAIKKLIARIGALTD